MANNRLQSVLIEFINDEYVATFTRDNGNGGAYSITDDEAILLQELCKERDWCFEDVCFGIRGIEITYLF